MKLICIYVQSKVDLYTISIRNVGFILPYIFLINERSIEIDNTVIKLMCGLMQYRPDT